MKWLVFLIVLAVIHLNVWMWDDSRIVWGFPVNLLYHLVWSLSLAPIMWVASKYASAFDDEGSEESKEGAPPS